jgi:hypothetical protein
MERLKSLDPPHKGLRNALSKLTLIAGKTDYASVSSVENLKLIAKEVFHLLKDHTATENKFILAPLEIRNPSFTQNYYSDHIEIDQVEQQLLERFLSLNGEQTNDYGHQLYLDLCNFQAHYLEHINEEDTVLEIEMLDHAHFLQALGNLFGRFVLGFKRVHQLEAHQVGQFDLHGHGAAVGRTAAAQAVAIAAPGVAVVHIDDGDGRPHAAFPQDSDKHVARGGI